MIGVVGSAVDPSPRVKVTDAAGTPVPGVVVRFDLPGGGGTVSGDSAMTGSDGTAAVGLWTLGPTPGPQQLRAQVPGRPLLSTLTLTASAGLPSALQVVTGGSGLSALAGQPLATLPVIRVRDRFGNIIAGAPITWSVVAGGGHLVGPATTTTDAAGLTTVGGWVLGPTPGINRLRYHAGPNVEGEIEASGVATPTSVVAASPQAQNGISSFSVAVIPRVTVLDEAAQPIQGVPVHFALMGGGGRIEGVDALTDADGIAALGDWSVGVSGTSEVRATVPGTSLPSVVFTATGTPRPFTIVLRFTTPIAADLRDQFVAAAARWMEIIQNDLPNQTIDLSAAQLSACPGNLPAVNETVDDLVIYAAITEIDGPGSVLGSAGNCVTRGGFGHPALGGMEFDTRDADLLATTHRFKDVVLHEMGHVLGLNAGDWGDHGLISGGTTLDPIYTGAAGLDGFSTLGVGYSGTPVPLENQGGTGTALQHWRESVLTTELMTGYIEDEGVPMPLSRLTIGSLADLGYTVDLSKADPFVGLLRAPGAQGVRGRTPIGERVVRPQWEILPDGTIRPID
jgi:hypothetical protein